jgi:hypothetical protein
MLSKKTGVMPFLDDDKSNRRKISLFKGGTGLQYVKYRKKSSSMHR